MTIAKEYPHSRWVIGRSLIHFSSKCHTKCRNQFKSVEQAQKKKLIPDLFSSKKLYTFAPDDES